MNYYPSARVALRLNFMDNPEKYYLLHVLPNTAKVTLNSYQQADEFEIKIDYRFFPVDPRTIRSCGIGIWMGTTEKFGDLIMDDPDDTLITGFVDDFEVGFDQEQSVTMKGRDFTGVLLDTKWFNGNVPLSIALDEAISWILAHNNCFQNIKVVNQTGETLPILSNIKLRKYKEHTPSNEDSYWDIIFDLCSQAGFICYIKLDELIISKPKVLYEQTNITRFVYGINLDSLKFRKNYGKQDGINVLVKCYDTRTKTTLTATFPDPPIDKKGMVVPTKNMHLNTKKTETKPVKKKSTKTKKVSQETPTETYEYTTFIVNEVHDQKTLNKIAENIWNQLYKRQIEGDLKTYDLQQVDSNSSLLKLRNGDPVAITLGQQFTNILSNMPYEQQLDFLVNRGFHPNVAKEVVRNLNLLDEVYYTQKVEFSWSTSEGISIGLDFVNYFEVDKNWEEK